MTELVVDAGVVVKLFSDENDSPAVRSHFGLAETISPELVLAEVWNAVWKKHRKGLVTLDQRTAIAASLEKPFTRLVPLRALTPQAVALSLRLNHPVYDCFYLPLATREKATL